MNFDEMSKLVADAAGVNICPICGVPFKKRHPKQKTCGADECKRQHKNQYLKERRERLMEEDIDSFRKERADVQRRNRRKKKEAERAERNLKKMQKFWDTKGYSRLDTDGHEYGAQQVERTLASVPKIDVEGFMRKENKDEQSASEQS